MRQYSKFITAVISAVLIILVKTVCKPCHGLMEMPCERSTRIAIIALSIVIVTDILSFIINKHLLHIITAFTTTIIGMFLLFIPLFGQCKVASMSCHLRTFPTLKVGGILIAAVSAAELIFLLLKLQIRRKQNAHT